MGYVLKMNRDRKSERRTRPLSIHGMRRCRGASLVEYGLLGSLVAVVSIGSLSSLGGGVERLVCLSTKSLSGALDDNYVERCEAVLIASGDIAPDGLPAPFSFTDRPAVDPGLRIVSDPVRLV